MKQDETLHIKNFIESINRADNSRQKEMKFDIETIKRVRNSLNMLCFNNCGAMLRNKTNLAAIERYLGD